MSGLPTRTNPTDHPVHELIRRRWSPVSFTDQPVTDDELRSMLEAARWAASCFNGQPWRYLIARKENAEEHRRMLDCLVEGNQTWAQHCPVLMIVVARTEFEHNDKTNRWAWHDCGLALANFMLQAVELGLFAHAMAGYKADAVRETYGVKAPFEPVCAVGLGHRGDGSKLPEETRQRDSGERSRKPLSEVVFEGRFGRTSSLFEG